MGSVSSAAAGSRQLRTLVPKHKHLAVTMTMMTWPPEAVRWLERPCQFSSLKAERYLLSFSDGVFGPLAYSQSSPSLSLTHPLAFLVWRYVSISVSYILRLGKLPLSFLSEKV